ncbi:hypothetical protein O3P69_002687 [Scylla paramamosain]|uniref:Uncharacterized protein n=1 Tax=Scylla paramamosain TaxID=85552 RepID=A0AAW0UN50_SCYPA
MLSRAEGWGDEEGAVAWAGSGGCGVENWGEYWGSLTTLGEKEAAAAQHNIKPGENTGALTSVSQGPFATAIQGLPHPPWPWYSLVATGVLQTMIVALWEMPPDQDRDPIFDEPQN